MNVTRTSVVAACLCLLITSAVAPRAQSTGQSTAEVELRAAMELEKAKGQTAAAIEAYKRLAQSSDAVVAEKARQALARLQGASATSVPGTETSLRLSLVCKGDNCADRSGSISRDGRWMVMGGAVWGGGALGLRNMDTGDVSALPAVVRPGDSNRHADAAVFSPDARQIAYQWGDDVSELRLIKREAGAIPRVLVSAPDIDSIEPVAWAADSGPIVVKVRRRDGLWELARASATDGALTMIRPLGWRMREESGLTEVSASPDGRFLVYSALAVNPLSQPAPAMSLALFRTAEQHLYIVSADGRGAETELTNTRGIDHNPIWSGDGNHVIFSSDRSGSPDLWALPMRDGAAAGAPFKVKSDMGTYFNKGVTTSGLLYYWQLRPPQPEVQVADFDTAGALPAVPRITEHFPGRLPSWSPQGNLLAYSGAGADPVRDKRVIHSLEKGDDRIFTPAGSLTQPAIWLSDGSGLLEVFRSAANPAIGVWQRLDLQRGAFEGIANLGNPDSFTAPALSADAKTLYRFGGARRPADGPADSGGEYTQLVAVDASTGSETPIVALPKHAGVVTGPALSPDGRTLALVYRESPKGDWIAATVSVAGGDYRDLGIVGGTPVSALAWTKDGRALLYVVGGVGRSNCRLMRGPANGVFLTFTGLEFQAASGCGGFSLSPDGRRIAFQGAQPAQELWAMDISTSALMHKK